MIDPDVNNYFKLSGGVYPLILCFNDRSPHSTRGQLNLARIMARRYDVDVVAWKHWPGRPEDVALIGEVTKRRALPPPAEPNGGSDDYPTPNEEEDEQSERSEDREAAGLGSDAVAVEPGV